MDFVVTSNTARFPDIRGLAAIGNLETVALVADTGNVEMLSYPRFDSPTLFCAALDRQAGHFRLAPTFAERGTQRYEENTNVLVTRFEGDGGAVVEVVDFMPLGDAARSNQLVRIARCVSGEATVVAACEPAFDYARSPASATLQDGAVVFADAAGQGPVRLAADRTLQIRGAGAFASVDLRAGETFALTLVCDNAPTDLVAEDQVDGALEQTLSTWREWADRSTYQGAYREAVTRSALALKLLFSQEHGGIVAAASFGLPEAIEGARNWDYRYAWIRDSAFTVYATMRLGYLEEAERYREWIEARVDAADGGEISLMYRVDGSSDLDEEELTHLSGYRGSQPVRIGNEAYRQTQLDIYGEVIDTLYIAHKHVAPLTREGWAVITKLADAACLSWQSPGAGFWEMRGEPGHYLDARLMAWVGLNRALRAAEKTGFPANERWRQNMEAIEKDIEANFFNEEIGAYVQTAGGTHLDATALLLPLMKYVSPTDERFRSTVAAIEERLVDGPLVRRYDVDAEREGVGPSQEGAFVACSFWYVEVLARMGRVGEAKANFEALICMASPLGLFAEELGASGEHLGNIPQALSHLALISAAVALERAEQTDGTAS